MIALNGRPRVNKGALWAYEKDIYIHWYS
jgi:hypothetical protein